MLRSRLIFRLEEQLEANIDNPGFVYEALKVYLMLGGQQPVDRELVLAWMRRDWADNLYPGAANAEGRKALEEHLVAMLDLESGHEPLIELDGPLIEDAQKTLARMSVAQRAYELLKSQARASSRGRLGRGAQAAAPTSRACSRRPAGEDLDSVRVPDFFTYERLPPRLHRAARRHRRAASSSERWVLGAAGEQAAVDAQYDTLVRRPARTLHARLRRRLARQRSAGCSCASCTADKPQYVALSAAARRRPRRSSSCSNRSATRPR